jgi:hypothetical protein
MKHRVIRVCLPARLHFAHESVLRLNDIDTSIVLSRGQLRDISRLSTNSRTGASSLLKPQVLRHPRMPEDTYDMLPVQRLVDRHQ